MQCDAVAGSPQEVCAAVRAEEVDSAVMFILGEDAVEQL